MPNFSLIKLQTNYSSIVKGDIFVITDITNIKHYHNIIVTDKDKRLARLKIRYISCSLDRKSCSLDCKRDIKEEWLDYRIIENRIGLHINSELAKILYA